MRMPLLLTVAALCVGAGGVRAQAPAQPHSLSLKVEPVSGGSEDATSASTHESLPSPRYQPTHLTNIHTSQTQTNKQAETLMVTVRNFGVLPDSAQVEWYFVAVPVKRDAQTPLDEQTSIFDKGSKSESLGAGGGDSFPVACKDLDSAITKHSQEYLGNHGKMHREPRQSKENQSGSTFGGWMIRLVADGKVVDARGSTDALESLAKNDSQLRALKGY